MPDKNPVWELMVPFEYSIWKVRVWWTDSGDGISPYHGIAKPLTEYLGKKGHFSYSSVRDVAKAISEYSDQVAAVEVTDPGSGIGCVFYPDWK